MNEFVAQCRREWKRLGVAEEVANEMAAELGADLDEAAAEGDSAEEVLGSSAFDPRSFAAAWAAERGVIGGARSSGREHRLIAALGALFVIVAVVGAVLVIPRSSPRPRSADSRTVLTVTTAPGPPGAVVWTAAGGEVRGRSFTVVAQNANDSDAHTLGAVLLVVGLAGTLLAQLWLSVGALGRPPRRAIS